MRVFQGLPEITRRVAAASRTPTVPARDGDQTVERSPLCRHQTHGPDEADTGRTRAEHRQVIHSRVGPRHVTHSVCVCADNQCVESMRSPCPIQSVCVESMRSPCPTQSVCREHAFSMPNTISVYREYACVLHAQHILHAQHTQCVQRACVLHAQHTQCVQRVCVCSLGPTPHHAQPAVWACEMTMCVSGTDYAINMEEDVTYHQ